MSNFDEALERFHQVDLEYSGGLVNHGPMAAQALVDLGHQALIPAFVDRYAPRLPPARSGRVLDPAEQAAARGDFARAADWIATFEARLEQDDWRDCVREVVPPLLPGLFAAAGHGLLRTVHAMRALEREDSALRRRELARGLAHWSARARREPDAPGNSDMSGASGGPNRAEPGASFRDVLAKLEAEAEAGADRVADALPRPAEDEVDGALFRVVRAAARVYLERPEARIGYAHAVTLPAAMRWLARRLAPTDARVGATCAIRAVGALHGLHGGTLRATAVDDEVAKTAESWDEIRYRAACSIEEHAIKLACACWLEARDAADPKLALAASDAALRIDGSRSAIRY